MYLCRAENNPHTFPHSTHSIYIKLPVIQYKENTKKIRHIEWFSSRRAAGEFLSLAPDAQEDKFSRWLPLASDADPQEHLVYE